MKSRKLMTIVLILLVIGSVSIHFVNSEAMHEGEKDSTLTLTDQAGRTVKIPKKVDDIVATGPGALRFVTYLNSADRVVGVERIEKSYAKKLPYNIANPHLRKLPTIGPPFGGNPELIGKVNPDVIFWRFASAGQANDLQKKTGIPVIVLGVGGPSGPWKSGTFYESLRLVGKVLGKEKRAERVIKFVEKTIQDLKNRTENIPDREKSEAYICAINWGKSRQSITSTMSDYSPFRFLHAKNVASGLNKRHAMVSEEIILKWNPEVIFIDQGGYSLALKKLKNPAYELVKAIRNGKLYRVWPYHSYEINFGMVLTNSYYIGKVLYPDRFDDVVIKEKANVIFEHLLGAKVYENVVDKFGEMKKVELK